MTTLATLLLKTGAVSAPEYESALRRQSLHGGDIGTSLLELGVLSELGLLSVLVEHLGLPAGPLGRLPAPSNELSAACPSRLARRHCIVPLGLSPTEIEVAVAAPLDPQIVGELASAARRDAVRAVVVTPLRLHEALWRYFDAGVDERLQRAIECLDGGRPSVEPPPGDDFGLEDDVLGEFGASELAEEALGMPAPPLIPRSDEPPPSYEAPIVAGAAAEVIPGDTGAVPDLPSDAGSGEDGDATSHLSRPPYRRMSERPTGVVVSRRQPSILRVVGIEAESARNAPTVPARDSLPVTDVSPPSAEPTIPSPPSFQPAASEAAGPPADVTELDDVELLDEAPTEAPGEALDAGGASGSATAFGVSAAAQAPSDEPPPSLRSELAAADAAAPGGRFTFRHRGPLTREQADEAVAHATDARILPEIFVYYGRQYFERVLLLVVHGPGDSAEVRTAHGAPPDLLGMQLDLGDDGRLSVAAKSGAMFVGPLRATGADAALTQALFAGMVEAAGRRIALVPLQVRGRVVALLYADDTPDDVDGEAVTEASSFAETVGAAMAALIVKRKARGRGP